MGTLCSYEEEIQLQDLKQKTTLDFDKQNTLLDSLIHERYKSAIKIQSRYRGYLTRMKILQLMNKVKR